MERLISINITEGAEGVSATFFTIDGDGKTRFLSRRFGDRKAAADFMARAISKLINESNLLGEPNENRN